jgi:PAS domain S-box-containing protein
MNPSDLSGQNPDGTPFYGSLKKTILASLLILGVIALAGIWGLGLVKQETKSNLALQLQTQLDTTVATVKGWSFERITVVELNATNPEIRQHILSLVQKTADRPKITTDELMKFSEQQWLHKHLGLITQKYNFTGFVVFDKTGLQVSALLNLPVGRRDLMEKSDFVTRALNGQSVLSVPFKSEIPLPDSQGVLREAWPTMFVAAPVFDDKGEVAAVLSFRLKPEIDFASLFKVARPGSSVETYAFNRQGVIISKSRFEGQLKSIGMLSPKPEISSLLNMEVRDPGGNTIAGFVPQVPRADQPLTRMAKSAVTGETSWDVEGYNDYRGVPVVGAWTWLKEFDFGVSFEIDVAEAYGPTIILNRTFLILFALLLSLAGLALILFHRHERAKESKVLDRQQTRQIARRMQSIFNSAIDAIIIIDQMGIIESFNPAAEEIFGYSKDEVIGHNVKLLMPEPYAGEHDGYLNNYKRTGKAQIIGTVRELTGLRKDGNLFFMELAVSEFQLDSGIKFTGVVRDISERKKIEQDMVLASQEAEKASNSKSQFLSQMSHELRTPLNAILGFAQILKAQTEKIDKNVHKNCVSHIMTAGKHLLELINEILDLSRIETGNLTVTLEPVELAPLVREVLAFCQPLATAHTIGFSDHISGKADHVVIANRVRLRQVLLNLVSNAIKYNREQGTVTLSCQIHDKHRLRIVVTDTGPGISEKDQQILFQPFSRLRNDVLSVEGTGIGLTISQMLVELMEGQISIISEVGKGSAFTVELPLSTEPLDRIPQEVETSQFSSVPESEAGLSILYIEDNPANMDLVEQILKSHLPDVKLLTATLGKTGLEMARKHHPSLILLDLNLPGMSGLEVFAKLKQSPETQDISVIAISSNAMEDDITKTLALGLDEYLTKPIILHEFLNTMNRYLGSAVFPSEKPTWNNEESLDSQSS